MTTIFSTIADDDVPPGIRRAAEIIEAGGRRATDHEPEMPRPLTWRELGAIVALVSMAFTVGYNWRELATLHAEYDKHVAKNDDEHKAFMPREVAAGQYLEIQRQLADVINRLEKADRKR